MLGHAARSSGDRLLDLRDLLHSAPSEAAWYRMQRMLLAWPEADGLGVGVDYACAHLSERREQWREVIHVVPAELRGAQLRGLDEPRLATLEVFGGLEEIGFVAVPPGRFLMGSPEGELGHDADETQHFVAITRPFAIATHAVTQREYVALMGHNPSWGDNAPARAAHPVESLSFYDAVAYCEALSARAGLGSAYRIRRSTGTPGTPGTPSYHAHTTFLGLSAPGFRLPTEAEWEYACRAGTRGATWAGELTTHQGADPVLEQIAWYHANCGGSTQPVGLKQPNPWGLYDMLGNVWEWCNDLFVDWDADLRERRPALEIDPTGGPVDDLSDVPGVPRVCRGGTGSVLNNDLCRAAQRGYSPQHNRNDNCGFRVVRTLLV